MNFFDRNCKSLSSSSLSSLSSSSSVNLQKISGVKRSSESWKSLSDVECARRNRARWLGRLSPSHRSFVTLKKGASDRAGTCSQYFFLKKVGHPRPLFLYFRLFNTHLTVNICFCNFCQWLDSNSGPLVSEATALPTEPQPLQLAHYIRESISVRLPSCFTGVDSTKQVNQLKV